MKVNVGHVPTMHSLSSTLFEPKCIPKLLLIRTFIPTMYSRDLTLNSGSSNAIRDGF